MADYQDQIQKLRSYIYSNQNTIQGLKLEIENIQAKIKDLKKQIYDIQSDYNDLKSKYIKLDTIQPEVIENWLKTRTYKTKDFYGQEHYIVFTGKKYALKTEGRTAHLPLSKTTIKNIEDYNKQSLSQNEQIISIKNKLLTLMDNDKQKINVLNDAIQKYQKNIDTYNSKIKEIEGYIEYAKMEIDKLTKLQNQHIQQPTTNIDTYKQTKIQQINNDQHKVLQASTTTNTVNKDDIIKLGLIFIISRILDRK